MVEPAANASPERQTAAGFGTSQIRLKPRKARPFYGRHPWVLDTAIDCVEGQPADGDVVDLVADRGKFVARGIYNSRSRIRVRLYSWDIAEALDAAFWRRRLATAVELAPAVGLRRSRRSLPARVQRRGRSERPDRRPLRRLAHGASHGPGMAARLPDLLPMLVEQIRPRGILLRTEKGVAAAEGLELRDGLIWGESPGGRDVHHRKRLALRRRSGRRAKDRVLSRSARQSPGGRRLFSQPSRAGHVLLQRRLQPQCHAFMARPATCSAFDSSQKAVALARANAEQNGVTNVRFEAADGFKALETLAAANERFGAVVLDPPKFARSRQSVDDAMRAYHRLNRLAVDVLEPGGILVTCSCSGHVTREDFLFMLVGVAQQTRRDLQMLEMRGRGARSSGKRHLPGKRISEVLHLPGRLNAPD